MEKKFNNMLIDFYELTMGQCYVNEGVDQKIAYFDVFFRKNPDNAGFSIANGIEECVKFINQFHFEKEDIDYLRSLGKFNEKFLQRLQNLKFTGDVYATLDGTVVFPNEPVLTIRAPLLEAQLLETALLVLFNHNSLITTKASRIVRSAQGRPIMEFGSRRAQGENAAIDGAVATYIAGVSGTACTATGQKYGIPVLGTMAHSFVQRFENEYEAFKAYANTFPDDCVLLIDTYDVLNSGIKNAVRVNNEVLKPQGKHLKGIRIDSGDLADLTKKARKILDENGLRDTKIVISNSLDEYKIDKLLKDGAPIDSFGVGENMITAKSQPVFGGVYKLVAFEENNKIIPTIKISEDKEKTTNPDFKNIFRIYDKKTGKIITDALTLHNEIIKKQENIMHKNIRVQMVKNGEIVYEFPTLEEKRKHLENELATLSPNALKLENAKKYEIILSPKLKDEKEKLINQHTINQSYLINK